MSVWPLNLQVPPPRVAEAFDRGGSGAEHSDSSRAGFVRSDLLPQAAGKVFGPLSGGGLAPRADHKSHHLAKRRVAQSLTDGQLVSDERMVVVDSSSTNRWMVGRRGLHHHAAALGASAGTPRNLGDQLAGAFGGTEVGKV